MLGKLLAARFNAWPGDSINLLSAGGGKPNPVTGSIVPRVDQFEVTGIVTTGMYEYDNAYVIHRARQGAGARRARRRRHRHRSEDRPTAGRRQAWRSGLVAALGWPYRTVDWEEQNHSLFQALKLEKLGMGVILLLIVLVAAFNIVSTLTMVVADKTKEIGILKAMGMPARSIRRIFFAQGLVIGRRRHRRSV